MNSKFIIHPSKNEIQYLDQGRPNQKLEPRIMKLLVYLASRPGEIFSRRQLLEVVWEDQSSLEEVLTLGISRLRKALGDNPRSPIFIQTVPREGYRLVAAVQAPELARLQYQRSFSEQINNWRMRRVVTLLALIGLFFTFIFFNNASTKAHLASPLALTPVTNAHGLEIHPVISPDGRYIAFSQRKNEGADFDLITKEIHSGKYQNLTKDLKGTYLSPTWSPTGEELIFAHSINGKMIVKKLCVDDRQVTKLFECNPVIIPDLDWSSNGKYLVFTDKGAKHFTQKVFLYDLENGQRIAMTEGEGFEFEPVFSPNANRILFIQKTQKNRFQIVEKRLDGTAEKVLIQGEKRMHHICWKNEREIFYTAGRGLLFELDLKTKSSKYLGLDHLDELSWSEKKQTLFATRYQADKNIWKFNVENGQTVPFMHSTNSESSPCVSPDSHQIAFNSKRSGKQQIWLGTEAESHPIQLTHFKARGVFGGKSWSPDGKSLAFIRREGGQHSLWLIRVENKELHQLFRSSHFNDFPQWSKTGDTIYFISDRSGKNEIWQISLEEGVLKQVTNMPEQIAFGIFNARLDSLYFTKVRQAGIWRKAFPDGQPELFLPGPGWRDFNNWVLTPRAIIFPDRSGHSLNIYSSSLIRGEKTAILQLNGGNQTLRTRISVNQGGNSIYFDQMDLFNTDIFAVKLAD